MTSLMRKAEVVAWLKEKNLILAAKAVNQLAPWTGQIDPNEVRYSQVKVSDLKNLLDAPTLRKLECDIVTHIPDFK